MLINCLVSAPLHANKCIAVYMLMAAILNRNKKALPKLVLSLLTLIT